MKAIIECEKGSLEKYKITANGDFVLSRTIKKPWIANYGFLKNTLQADNDGLDCYVLGNAKQGDEIDVYPIAMIYYIDNGIVDNKLICLTENVKIFNLKLCVKRIKKCVQKYKPNCFVAGITWYDGDIRYEIAKCKSYYELFNGGI